MILWYEPSAVAPTACALVDDRVIRRVLWEARKIVPNNENFYPTYDGSLWDAILGA